MTGRRLAGLAAVVLLSAAAAAHAAAPASPPAPQDPFEAAAAAAKTAMMADPQAALARSLEALAIARRETGDTAQHVATAQWLEGEALWRLNRLPEAGAVVEQGLATVAARAPNSKLRGDLVMAQAEVRASQGAVQPALQGFQAAYRIFGRAKQPRSQAKALMAIGSIYQDAGDYPKVLEYYAQAADLYPADLALLITADNNIARALNSQKKYPAAVAAFERARLIARKMQSPQLEAQVLSNLAAAEVAWGRLDAAQRHLDEDLHLARTYAEAHDEQPAIWGVAAQLQLQRHHPKVAAAMLARTFAGVDLATSPAPFREFHDTAWQTYTQLGDEHLALAHLAAFKRLDDEARVLAASTTAALMSAQFDFANQKTRISQLKAGQLQSRNLITTVLLIGSTIIAGLLAASFLWIRRSRNAVRAANGKLSEANYALEKALKARTEFLATTSHEIRTPLNGILGMTQVLLGESKLDAETREQIALVHGAGETMRALVDDILDIAKMETGGVQLVRAELDLPLLCRETASLWAARAKAKAVALNVSIDEAPVRIVEDCDRLRQILFNLMSNALKFTEAGSVTLKVTVEQSVDLAGAEDLVLAVADTGIGIAQAKLEEVFETFRQGDTSTTRAYEGTGLGLAICRRLAQAMGGDIHLASALGEGTTVTVRLPLERGVEIEADEIVIAPRALNASRTLVCDANPLSQAVIKAALGPHVRALEAARSVEQAIGVAASGRFDLIVVDAAALGQERQTRLAALRDLASAVTPAVVCVMIPDIGEDEAGRLLGAGAAQIICKPIAAAALAAELQAGFIARDEAGVGQVISAA